MKKSLIVATKNQGKLREFNQLLNPLGWTVQGLDSFPQLSEVIEDGETFEANALKKAREIGEALGCAVIADDSGLIVDALGGQPGIFSARYAGVPSNDRKNNEKLLRELENVPDALRTAHFVCVLAFYQPGKPEWTVRGTCSGKIGYEPQGNQGFGYDPLFIVPELGKTMAELSSDIKNEISHRAKAMMLFMERIGEQGDGLNG